MISISPLESFIRMITTDLGSRVMRPDFGSNLFLLIDKDFNNEWIIDFKRYCLEACFDKDGRLWDMRVLPDKLKVLDFNTENNKLTVKFYLKLQNGNEYTATI